MKKLLSLLLSLCMVFFCACGSDTKTETSEDVVEDVAEEVAEEETDGESFEPSEYLNNNDNNDSGNDEIPDGDFEYEDTMSDLPEDTQQFIGLLIGEDYSEICDIYGINRDDFPDEDAEEMISMAFGGESPEAVLYEYVDSYEMPTETATEETSQIVCVTRTGSKYHSAGCQYLKKSCIEKDLSVAESQGYTPCSKCW